MLQRPVFFIKSGTVKPLKCLLLVSKMQYSNHICDEFLSEDVKALYIQLLVMAEVQMYVIFITCYAYILTTPCGDKSHKKSKCRKPYISRWFAAFRADKGVYYYTLRRFLSKTLFFCYYPEHMLISEELYNKKSDLRML